LSNVRVVTFNIRNGRGLDGWNSWPFRRRRLAELVASFEADVIALQEVFAFQQRYLARRLPGYAVVSRPRGRWIGERAPVFYNTSALRVVSSRTCWFSQQPDEPGSKLPRAAFPRVATMVVFEQVQGGRRFGLTNLHLDAHVAANRELSVLMLHEWLDPSLDSIVLGDFNAQDGDLELVPMLAEGFESVLDDDAPGTNHGFTRNRDGTRIDHIFVRGSLQVDDAHVETDCDAPATSDHWPVVADFSLPPNS
jgi:endonuclease/exonuclease/phosphatase family metal-dependent hydrolase